MTSRSDIAVSVRGLSKSYTIAHDGEKHVTLAESLLARARRPFARTPQETFWALKDVSFDIKKGDVVGIIGRNGAGKSTLLKILSRITEPTAGQIDLYGRVGSLLEVGTGFHPELTGRENVYLNGAILGMTKAEIRKQFGAIVDFAGVEQFLDTPVKRYSSGMYVRLAFAVAAHLETEILVLDEVLAVGDATFQQRCIGKVREVARDGRTTLIVSHNIGVLKSTCDQAILLQSGHILKAGAARDITRSYERAGTTFSNKEWRNDRVNSAAEATIISVDLTRTEAANGECVSSSESFELSFLIEVRQQSDLLKFGFDLIKDEVIVFRSQQVDSPNNVGVLPAGRHRINCTIPADLLFAGIYEVEPHMSLHCVKWLVLPSTDRLRFSIDFDSRNSPFLNLLNPDNHPGHLFPRLSWRVDHQNAKTPLG